ncbi:DUF2330 domain-containing protein [Nannocystaceae bacterium ST9]
MLRTRWIVLATSLSIGVGLSGLAEREAAAFCGFYVAGADAELFNDATVVVLMRDGTHTVVSMSNAYQGPPEEFALVVPVPVVLKEADVVTLRRELFDRIDTLASPRLVEYWEGDPCVRGDVDGTIGLGNMGVIGSGSGYGRGSGAGTVKIEAQFEVGEYEIVILSASESSGLESWLRDNGYNIPAGAEPLLRPYVQQDMKFFVAKVDPAKVKFEGGRAMLSPLRFHYESKDFALPVRLGLINAPDPTKGGKQDLLIHILAPTTRYAVANYPNVTIPTNLDVNESAKDRFGEFYVSLFDHTLAQNPGAIVTEYAWSAGSCDPCPGPDAALTNQELLEFGGDVLPNWSASLSNGIGPAPTIRPATPKVGVGLDRDIVRRIVRAHVNELRACYLTGLASDPKLAGRLAIDFTIDAAGEVEAATLDPVESTMSDASVGACVIKAVGRWRFPKPIDATSVAVHHPFELAPTGGTSTSGAAGSFVLTRLHARYDANALAEDLVFEAAPAIVGGREFGVDGTLERGATASLFGNNFQARYAVRHPWAGEIACADPIRGMWGGPPEGESSSTTVARRLAGLGRGASLGGFVTASAGEQIGLATPAKVEPAKIEPAKVEPAKVEPTKAEPSASSPASTQGCTCSNAALEPPVGVGLFGLLGLVTLLGLRRRRREP